MPRRRQIFTSPRNNHLLGEKFPFLCQVCCRDFWSTGMSRCLHCRQSAAAGQAELFSSLGSSQSSFCAPSHIYSVKKEALLLLILRYPTITKLNTQCTQIWLCRTIFTGSIAVFLQSNQQDSCRTLTRQTVSPRAAPVIAFCSNELSVACHSGH